MTKQSIIQNLALKDSIAKVSLNPNYRLPQPLTRLCNDEVESLKKYNILDLRGANANTNTRCKSRCDSYNDEVVELQGCFIVRIPPSLRGAVAHFGFCPYENYPLRHCEAVREHNEAIYNLTYQNANN